MINKIINTQELKQLVIDEFNDIIQKVQEPFTNEL